MLQNNNRFYLVWGGPLAELFCSWFPAPGCTVTLADPPVAVAEGLLVLCWLMMATAIALESAWTFPDTPTTLEELPVAIAHAHDRHPIVRLLASFDPRLHALSGWSRHSRDEYVVAYIIYIARKSHCAHARSINGACTSVIISRSRIYNRIKSSDGWHARKRGGCI